MKTILVLLENTIESDFAKTILSKTGFNVLSRQYDISAKLQHTFPDVVITSSLANQKKSLDELIQLKANKGIPKFIWIGAQDRFKKLDDETRKVIDFRLESPIQPEKMIEAICHLTGLSAEEVIKHYRSLYLKSLDKANVKKTLSSEERLNRYKSISDQIESKDMVFSAKELKKRGTPDAGAKNTTTLLDQKKEFLKTLFKK